MFNKSIKFFGAFGRYTPGGLLKSISDANNQNPMNKMIFSKLPKIIDVSDDGKVLNEWKIAIEISHMSVENLDELKKNCVELSEKYYVDGLLNSERLGRCRMDLVTKNYTTFFNTAPYYSSRKEVEDDIKECNDREVNLNQGMIYLDAVIKSVEAEMQIRQSYGPK